MPSGSDLHKQRAAVQAERTRHERRERTVVDLRMIRETLEDRVLQLERGAEPRRTDDDLKRHVERFLKRHVDGDRPLGYLGEALGKVDIERYAEAHFEQTVVPALAMDGPGAETEEEPFGRGVDVDTGGPDFDGPNLGGGRFDFGGLGPRDILEPERDEHVPEVSFEDLRSDPFPDALLSFLDAVADGSETESDVETVTSTYDDLITSESSAGRLRPLSTVGALVDVARLTVVGEDDDPITGTRSRLAEERAEHVTALEDADERLVDDDVTSQDPFVDLDWDDPIAMLPVRLETRFDDGDLKVRVYPEQFHVDTHEHQLTEDEHDWGVRFWTRLWVAGVPEPEQLLTVDGTTVPPTRIRREAGELVVPDAFPEDWPDTVLGELPTRDAGEAALELLRAIGADEFSEDSDARYEEVRERAWARGVEKFGEERATYVIEALAPTTMDDGTPVSERLRAGFDDSGAPLSEPVDLEFPTVDMRPGSWTRTPRARLLPDRFVVRAYYEADDDQEYETDWSDETPANSDLAVYERRVGTEWVRRVAGPVVREPLAVGPSPESVAEQGGDANSEMAWMTEYDEAENAGLGITVPLPDREDYDDATGFSKVVVTGAKTTMTAEESRVALSDLLDATAHTEGLELLSPGTPTNNADEPSARSDGHDPSAALDAATGPALATSGTDGRRLADALGIPRSTFAHVPGAGDTRDRDAEAMNRGLWPATIGYYVRNLLVPGGDSSEESPDEPPLLGTGPSDTGEGPPTLLWWLETYRDHFVDHVRSGGPFKTIRAGNQPYGILPVAPIDVRSTDRSPIEDESMRTGYEREHRERGLLTASTGSGFEQSTVPRIPEYEFVPEVVDRVWSLRDDWLDFETSVPSVADDPGLSEDDLLSMLAMEATAFSYRRQMWLLGSDNPIYEHMGLASDSEAVANRVASNLQRAGLSPYGPRIAELLFLGASVNAAELPITDADVGTFVDTVLDLYGSEYPIWALRALGTDPSEDTFRLSASVRTEMKRELFLDTLDPSDDEADYDPGASLLRQLLRFAALQAAIASRVRLGAVYGWATGEYVTFPAEPTAYGPGKTTVFELFGDPLPSGTPMNSSRTLSAHPGLVSGDDFNELLQVTAGTIGEQVPPPDPELAEFMGALSHLSTIDADRLGRLTTETMDLASHRLDAWWTSLATRQLTAHRKSSNGIQIGAFGFVEDLAPGSGPDAEYLLAPSLDQTTTAAVLRSAHAARSRPNDPSTSHDESAPGRALAVDCSPEAVKLARPVLRGVRRGLDLSELLGFRFERGLRSYSEEHGMNLEQYLDDFRDLAPTVEDKLPRGDTEVGTRQSDVADGMQLYRLWKSDEMQTELQSVLDASSISSDLEEALGGLSLESARETGVFPAIHRAMEAVNDVLLAEGVHHLVHGRPERAAAALEALSRGETPPEPTVLDTPRSETGVTHRLLLAFGDGDDPTTPSPWNPPKRAMLQPEDVGESLVYERIDHRYAGRMYDDAEIRDQIGFDGGTVMDDATVRTDAEPALDAWVGSLLPNPEKIGCTGEFQWERERTFAVGEFETPTEQATVTVDDVGFRPDVVQFTAVPAATDDAPSESHAAGWNHGAFKRAVGGYDEVQQATAAAVADDGTVHYRGSEGTVIELQFAANAAPGQPARVSGTVSGTTPDGFEIEFEDVGLPSDGPERVAVQYRALKLADPTSVRVGWFRTPGTEPSDTIVEAFDGGATDGFVPDHVTFSVCLPIGGVTGNTTSDAAIGVAHGEVVDTGEGFVQQTTGIGLDPSGDDFHVSARDDAVLDVETGDDAFRVAVTDWHDRADAELNLDVSAPGSASYPGRILVPYIAVESPTVETPAGERRKRPALGTTAAPASTDDTVAVDTGFRPGLIELRFAPGLRGEGSDSLPVSSSVSAADASLSLGAATGTVVQRSLASGVTGDGASADRTPTAIGSTPTTGDDGVTEGVGVQIDRIGDSGFELSFSNLPSDAGPLIQYRAWPEDPESEGFSVPLEWSDSGAYSSRPDGLSLDDLDLTPLDAVAITQGVEQSGDSQLERRFGYFAFRHRPENRPPIPDDATLDLAFTEPSPDHDVSIAEYIEVARRVDDLTGEARPANAGDLAHPSEAGDEGYLSGTTNRDGTAERLAARADGLETKLGKIQTLLSNRYDLLSPESNVCDEIAELEAATRAFRRAAPVSQVVGVTEQFATEHPGPTHQAIDGTVLADLRAVKESVRAGPTEDVDADIVVDNEAEQTVEGVADVSGRTDLSVVVRSHSDAVHFTPKRDDTVETNQSGWFETTFDFSNIAPGTAFTVTASTEGSGSLPDPIEKLLDVVAAMDREEQFAFLVQLTAADLYDPPSGLASARLFRKLVEAVEDEFEVDLGDDPIIDHETVLERRSDLLSDLIDVIQLIGVTQWFARLTEDDRLELFEDLSESAALRLLALLGFEEYVREYRDGGDAGGIVYAASGRVVDAAETGGWRDLSAETERGDFLPWLLWLDRVLPAFQPGAAEPAAELDEAIGVTDWDSVTDELDVMRTMLTVLNHQRPNADVFSQTDVDAVKALRELRDLDLRGLRDAIERVIGPAEWTGMTALVSLTGHRDRPDDQRYWRSSSPAVDALVEKHPEGEVRARLERLIEHPRTDAPAAVAAYSPPLRRLLAEGQVDPALLANLEALVAAPADLVSTFGDVDSDLPALIDDIHDLLHHVDETDPATVSDLPNRVESFVVAVDDAGRLDELTEYVEAPGDLVSLLDNTEPRLTNEVAAHLSSASRPRQIDDFLTQYAGEPASAETVARAELSDRIVEATEYETLAESFRSGVLESVRHSLLRASYFGIYGTVPAAAAGGSADDEETLVTQIERTLETVKQRHTASVERAPDGSEPTVDGQVERLQALLGDEFVVLPPFAPTNPSELHATLTDKGLGGDRYEADTWLQRVGRVRDLPADFQRVRTYADSLGLAGGATGGLSRSLTIGQLPHVPGQEWLGKDGVEPTGGELSLGIQFANEHDGTGPLSPNPASNGPALAGLLIDEWVERVPAETETAGLGLRYDDPSTRAPQSVLLAVPPTWQRPVGEVELEEGTEYAGPTRWTESLLAETMEETLDLVKLRSVDLEALEDFGHLLPMLCFAYNRNSVWDDDEVLPDAPSVDFTQLDWEGWF